MSDAIRLTDGKGFFYDALITKADPQKCTFEVQQKFEEPKKNFSIHIAISPTKNADRIEWFVEKATEIGIDQITLMECENTERAFVKIDRLEKVAISAMKQSLKAHVPILNSLTSFSSLIDRAKEEIKMIAYVDYSNPDHVKSVAPPEKTYLILIGPEGDFLREELADAERMNFKKVSLGKSRLRTETAGIAACHILNLIQKD